MLYGTTSDFLRCFGLEDLTGLPKTSDELIQAFNNAKESEAGAEESDEIVGAEQLSADIDAALPESEAAPSEAPSTDNAVELDEPSAEDDIITD